MVGAVEKWIVSAPPGPVAHSFHIHVNPFMFTRPDGRVVWKDTLHMPAGSKFELRTRYDRYIGTFVNHCHMLDHEDFGMMETLGDHPAADGARAPSPLA